MRSAACSTEAACSLRGIDPKAWCDIGGTGRGKSTLLANTAGQFVRMGEGFTLLDPGGDLARAVLAQVPAERLPGVLMLDVRDRNRPCPLNVLSARDDVERAVLTEELLGVFERLHGSSWGPMLAHQLRLALRTAMLAGGTLRDVYDLFTDATARARLVGRVRDPRCGRSGRRSSRRSRRCGGRRSAVTNKLAPLVFHPILARILGAPECALGADRAIAERRIVLVNLASGMPATDVTTLLGSFLVQRVVAAAFRQGRLPPQRRVRHYLLVDEFQRFMHQAAGFDQILAEARKYALSLIVANQVVEQLADSVRAALFGNVGALAAFRVGHRDARVLAPEFAGCEPEELLELGLGECLLQIGSDWAQLRTLPPPRPTDRPTEVSPSRSTAPLPAPNTIPRVARVARAQTPQLRMRRPDDRRVTEFVR